MGQAAKHRAALLRRVGTSRWPQRSRLPIVSMQVRPALAQAPHVCRRLAPLSVAMRISLGCGVRRRFIDLADTPK